MGINRHQEYPWLGDAIPKWIQIQDMYDIKFGLGHNFMRAAHYPNDPLIYDIANQLGIIMVEEVPNIKNINFNETVQEQNVREMIRRDRNHPSIFFWSMGNETSNGADSRWAIEEDTTRIIHARKAENTGDFVAHDHSNLDMEHLLRVTIRGWFTEDDAPDSSNVIPGNGQHASSETWQHQMAMNRGGSVRGILNENTMAWLYEDHGADREYKNTPVLHINPKGWVDNYRIPKYLYFLTKANYLEEPVLFIHPHYWRQRYLNQRKDLVVDSNCDEVEIFVNEVSKGIIYPCQTEFNSSVLKNVLIEEGTLKAVGKKGEKSIEVKFDMPTNANRILLTSTHERLPADKGGLAIITAYILDKEGNVVFDAQDELEWEVIGQANLVGPALYVSDLNKHEEMEGIGYLCGPVSNVIRTTNRPGKIHIKVSSSKLKDGEIILSSYKPEMNQVKGLMQPELTESGRLNVERVEDFVEKIEFEEIINRITENQDFRENTESEFQNEVDKFIREHSNEVELYPTGYHLFLNQIIRNITRLNGILIADDFNFLAEQFNNYAMIVNTIDASNLHVIYSEILKEFYAEEILGHNKLFDYEYHVELIQSITRNHIPLYLENPDEKNVNGKVENDYVSKTFKVWSGNSIEGLFYAFPSYKNLSKNELQIVCRYIAQITPYTNYNNQTKSFEFEKDKLLIKVSHINFNFSQSDC